MSLLEVLKQRGEKAESRRQDAIAETRRLAARLRERFAYEALYLLGSILTPAFSRRSDIDMVIKGLEVGDFFKAHAFLLKECSHEIDLKPFEDLDEFSRRKVLSEGLKIG